MPNRWVRRPKWHSAKEKKKKKKKKRKKRGKKGKMRRSERGMMMMTVKSGVPV